MTRWPPLEIERRPGVLVLNDRGIARLPRILVALFIFTMMGLTVRDFGPYWWVLLITRIFCLLGVALVGNTLVRAEIDRTRRELRITERWLWGRTRARVIPFGEVDRVDVEVVPMEGTTAYHPRVVLKSGTEQPISGGDIYIEERATGIADLVRAAVLRRR
jgi:membrane protein YdbS with pleckstrin-like domain